MRVGDGDSGGGQKLICCPFLGICFISETMYSLLLEGVVTGWGHSGFRCLVLFLGLVSVYENSFSS